MSRLINISPNIFPSAIQQPSAINSDAGLLSRLLAAAWSAPAAFYRWTQAIATAVMPKDREHRLRSASHVVESLEKKLRYAQEQMEAEKDNPAFQDAPVRNSLKAAQKAVGPFPYAICHYQGKRPSMEDQSLADTINIHGSTAQVFALFDGHGGKGAASFAKDHLLSTLQSKLESFNPQDFTPAGIWNALKMTCVSLSEQYQGRGGTTAAIMMVLNGELWIANVGDSRVILNANGRAIQCSEDMKPAQIDADGRLQPTHFTQRIYDRRGFITERKPPRINGILSCGGSIGDHEVVGVSARPAITRIPLSSLPDNTEALIVCDGVTDVASTRQLALLAQSHEDGGSREVARAVVASAYRANSKDNISCLAIQLKKNRS